MWSGIFKIPYKCPLVTEKRSLFLFMFMADNLLKINIISKSRPGTHSEHQWAVSCSGLVYATLNVLRAVTRRETFFLDAFFCQTFAIYCLRQV
jgi:hypothetical protein